MKMLVLRLVLLSPRPMRFYRVSASRLVTSLLKV